MIRARQWVRVAAATLGVVCLGVAGCTVGPNYEPPKADVPGAWSATAVTGAGEAKAGEQQDLVRWWTEFNDEKLTSLEERAMKSNLDLKQAEARIRQARASWGVAEAGRWPTVALNASAIRSRTPGTGAAGHEGNLFQAGLDASWETDIFGGVRRNVEAAKADVQAAVEDRRDVMVTLTAEVGLNYVTLRGLQQRIAIARKNLELQQHTAKVTQEKFHAGFVGSLDVANADALAASTASAIPLLESSARQTIYNLSILLGSPPNALTEELSPEGEIPAGPPTVPTGVPSELLRRRPDIRRAEAQIHGATARIGVAVAQLYPNFTITGNVGLESSQLHELPEWASRFWSIGPQASWTVFDAGARESQVKLQQALADQSMLTYRQTVLTALQEVENSLVASEKEQEHKKALEEAVAANRKAVDVATQLYTEGGLTDFLNVLDAERSLLLSEDALVQSNQNVSTDLVSMYKALGGGWEGSTGSVPAP